jgi:hypothetical protein
MTSPSLCTRLIETRYVTDQTAKLDLAELGAAVCITVTTGPRKERHWNRFPLGVVCLGVHRLARSPHAPGSFVGSILTKSTFKCEFRAALSFGEG